jgi:excisionase family DNA binding protein
MSDFSRLFGSPSSPVSRPLARPQKPAILPPDGSGEVTSELDAHEQALADFLPIEKIPAFLARLAERLRSRRVAASAPSPQPERLLTAAEMAERLSVPESWIRTEERARRIPGVRVGRYVRFRASEVEAALEGNGPR